MSSWLEGVLEWAMQPDRCSCGVCVSMWVSVAMNVFEGEGAGAVDTTEKGLSCVWVGARNSVYSLCYACLCSCIFVNIRRCSYLCSLVCAQQNSEQTLTHELIYTPLFDTHSLYCCFPAVLWPSGPGAMPPYKPRGSGRTQGGLTGNRSWPTESLLSLWAHTTFCTGG